MQTQTYFYLDRTVQMKAYQIKAGQQIGGLEAVRRVPAPPAAHEVQVRVHAVSLNYP